MAMLNLPTAKHNWNTFPKQKERSRGYLKLNFVKGALAFNVTLFYQGKGNDLCGSSTWKVAHGESSSKRNLDITGLEMMSCNHGTVVYSANLLMGETFKHTHLQHLKSHEMGT